MDERNLLCFHNKNIEQNMKQLPNELQVLILVFVDKSIVNTFLISKYFGTFAMNEDLWRMRLQKDFQHITRTQPTWRLEYKGVFMESLKMKMMAKRGAKRLQVFIYEILRNVNT
jgi:hypothetical protein